MGKVLGLVGSPRRDGNSEIITNTFLSGVETRGLKTEKILLNKLDIHPCQACDACAGSGYCVVRDDMQNLYPKIKEASGLLLVSPIYFSGISAQTKAFIDRFQCWWHARYGFHRPFVEKEDGRLGFFISVEAMQGKEWGQKAIYTIRSYFNVINYSLEGSLHFQGIDALGSIEDSPDALTQVKNAGMAFADKAKLNLGEGLT